MKTEQSISRFRMIFPDLNQDYWDDCIRLLTIQFGGTVHSAPKELLMHLHEKGWISKDDKFWSRMSILN